MEWASRSRPDYAGWLQVYDSGENSSEVVLHLSFLDELDRRYREDGEHAEEMRRGLRESLDNIADAVAG